LAQLREKKLTPGAFLLEACDGKFTDEDVTDEGNEFTLFYFDLGKGEYLADYEKLFCAEGAHVYAVPDTWESFDRLAPVISRRFKEWKKPQSVEAPSRPWWRFGL
jgi:hypothetical protein